MYHSLIAGLCREPSVLDYIFILYCLFKVAELRSNLNVKVTPSSGCVPGGGVVELNLNVCPTLIGSFDVKISVCIRGNKQLYIRLSGTVEQPSVTVEKVGLILVQNYVLSTTCDISLCFHNGDVIKTTLWPKPCKLGIH